MRRSSLAAKVCSTLGLLLAPAAAGCAAPVDWEASEGAEPAVSTEELSYLTGRKWDDLTLLADTLHPTASAIDTHGFAFSVAISSNSGIATVTNTSEKSLSFKMVSLLLYCTDGKLYWTYFKDQAFSSGSSTNLVSADNCPTGYKTRSFQGFFKVPSSSAKDGLWTTIPDGEGWVQVDDPYPPPANPPHELLHSAVFYTRFGMVAVTWQADGTPKTTVSVTRATESIVLETGATCGDQFGAPAIKRVRNATPGQVITLVASACPAGTTMTAANGRAHEYKL